MISKSNPALPLRADLARKIASLIGTEENRITEIPGVSLHRRTAPTPPCRTTYHPGIIVVAQGSKQVNLGKNSFIYDEAHYAAGPGPAQHDAARISIVLNFRMVNGTRRDPLGPDGRRPAPPC